MPNPLPNKKEYSSVPIEEAPMKESPSRDVETGRRETKRKKKGCLERFLLWLKALFCCCLFCCDDHDEAYEVPRQSSGFQSIEESQHMQTFNSSGTPLNHSQEDYENLQKRLKEKKEANERLENELKSNKAENKELRLRLSEMASERMRKENPCVEDLNDRHRPTALAEKWNSLFKTGEYWTTYDKLQGCGFGDTKITNTLYRVCEIVYTTCTDLLSQIFPTLQPVWPEFEEEPRRGKEDFQHQLDLKISSPANGLKSLLPDSDVDTKELRSSIEAIMRACHSQLKPITLKLKEPISKLLKPEGVPKLLQERVLQAIRDSDIGVESAIIEKFANSLLELCYRMHLHNIPMAVSFHFKPGSNFDSSLLETEGSAAKPSSDAKIKSVLRPPLLREEGGAVLSKGEVELEPERKSPVTTEESTEKSMKKEAATDPSSEESSPKRDPTTRHDPNFTPPNVPKTTTSDKGNTKSVLSPPQLREKGQMASKGEVKVNPERKSPVTTEESTEKSKKKEAAINAPPGKLSPEQGPTTRHDPQFTQLRDGKTTTDDERIVSTKL